MQCLLPIQVLLAIGSVVDSHHFWRALSLLWVAGSSVILCRDLEPPTVLKFAAPAAGTMIQIVRNGGAVVFGVARAQPGRANILNWSQ
jgi:hypothetical protein